MARLIVSAPAQADSSSILRHLAVNAGRTVAARYATSFETLFERLARHPQSGAPRAELGPDVRICLAPPYIIIYEFDPTSKETVTVLRIVHGSRRITGKMLMSDTL